MADGRYVCAADNQDCIFSSKGFCAWGSAVERAGRASRMEKGVERRMAG